MRSRVRCGSRTEVQRGPRNVRSWGYSRLRFRAAGGQHVAKLRHELTVHFAMNHVSLRDFQKCGLPPFGNPHPRSCEYVTIRLRVAVRGSRGAAGLANRRRHRDPCYRCPRSDFSKKIKSAPAPGSASNTRGGKDPMLQLNRDTLVDAYTRMKTIRDFEDRVHTEFAKIGRASCRERV